MPVCDSGIRIVSPNCQPQRALNAGPNLPCSKGSGRRKRCDFLLRTFSGQHHAHSLKQDHQVEKQGVVLDVVQIVLELLG